MTKSAQATCVKKRTRARPGVGLARSDREDDEKKTNAGDTSRDRTSLSSQSDRANGFGSRRECHRAVNLEIEPQGSGTAWRQYEAA